VEVAVLGGGFVGVSAAYWLRRMGHEPILLEAGHLAGRASGRNAGMLLTGSPEPFQRMAERIGEEAARAFWELSRENRELLRSEVLDDGAPSRVECELQAEGSWLAVFGEDTAELEALKTSGDRLAALGFDVEWHEGEPVRRASGSPRVQAALYQPRDVGLDPVCLCRALARQERIRVRTGAWVHRIETREPLSGPRYRIIADGGSVLADRIVIALNPYAPALLPWLARELRPVRGQMISTDPGDPVMTGIWYLNHGFEYVRQTADGSVLAGGGRRASRRAQIGYLEYPSAGVQGSLEEFLVDHYPALVDRPIARRWAGVMAFTDDGLPLAGEAPDLPGVVYAAGFNGHGMSLGFATGRWLARRVLGETGAPLLPPSVPAPEPAAGSR
jgi:glycine/D-amino acid oxidase-like deaminating enzyme